MALSYGVGRFEVYVPLKWSAPRHHLGTQLLSVQPDLYGIRKPPYSVQVWNKRCISVELHRSYSNSCYLSPVMCPDLEYALIIRYVSVVYGLIFYIQSGIEQGAVVKKKFCCVIHTINRRRNIKVEQRNILTVRGTLSEEWYYYTETSMTNNSTTMQWP